MIVMTQPRGLSSFAGIVVPAAVFVAIGAVLYLGVEWLQQAKLERDVAMLQGRTYPWR